MNLEEKKNLRIENFMRLIIELNKTSAVENPLMRHIKALSLISCAQVADFQIRATKADNVTI